MVLTGRAAVLAALGAIVVGFAAPSITGVLVVSGVLLTLCLVDVALAGPVRAIRLHRTGDRTVRLGQSAHVTLHVVNDRRPLRGVLRDAWPPSAGAVGERAALDIEPGGRQRVVVSLGPTRRGDRRADRITIRSLGPLGLATFQQFS